ncbi:hypothetical protein Bca4012_020031 [Brassica carinata]
MSMKSTGLSHISTEKSQVTVYFNDVSQDQLSQSFDFGRSEIGPWRWSRPVEIIRENKLTNVVRSLSCSISMAVAQTTKSNMEFNIMMMENVMQLIIVEESRLSLVI